MENHELLQLKELFPDSKINRSIEKGTLDDAINILLHQNDKQGEIGDEFDLDELLRLKKQYPSKDEFLLLETLKHKHTKIIFKKPNGATLPRKSVNEQEYDSLKEMFSMFSEESIFRLLQQKSYKESMDELLRQQNIQLFEQDEGLQELMELFPLISRSELKKRLKNSSLQETIDEILEDSKNIWSETRKIKQIPSQSMEYNFNFVQQESINTNTNTIGDSREEAEALTVKRNHLFERAKIEFKKGQTGKLAAQFYSQQAHQMTKTINQIHSNAANKIFISNNPDFHAIYKVESIIQRDDGGRSSKSMTRIGNNISRQNSMSTSSRTQSIHSSGSISKKEYYQLDFHGLTLGESKEKLDVYLKEWASIKNRDKWLKIITGAGNHSISGVGVLYKGLKNYVMALGWKVESGGNGWFFATE
jgi:hypothetical protein